MFTLTISAHLKGHAAFDNFAVHRCNTLMKKLWVLKESPELVIGRYNDEQELAVRCENCKLSVAHIRAIMREFSQEACMISWDRVGVAEMLYLQDEMQQSLKLNIQKVDVLPDTSGTFVPRTQEYMVAT